MSPIRVRHIVQCDGCHEYLADRALRLIERHGTTTPGEFMAKVFTGCYAAEAEAKIRGWSVYPLLCPACAADAKARVHQEAASEQVRDHRNPE